MNETHVFDAYGRYYDLLYRDKDYAAEVNYINSLLKEYGLSGNELLEFGSGTGKHGSLLSEKGYRVTGIERSEKMVKEAQQTDGFTCQHGDIRKVNLNRIFNGVLALFHVVSYQITNSDVQAVFTRAANHLTRGGLFLFDVWYSPAVYHLKPETRVKRMSNDEVEVIRIAEPKVFQNENRVDVNYTVFVKDKVDGAYQTFSETHPMRHFSIPEIDLKAASAGFKRLAVEEFFTGKEPGEKTWGVCFILIKI